MLCFDYREPVTLAYRIMQEFRLPLSDLISTLVHASQQLTSPT